MLDALQSMALNGVSFLSINRSVICAFSNTLKNLKVLCSNLPETLLLCCLSCGVGEVVAKVGAQCWHLRKIKLSSFSVEINLRHLYFDFTNLNNGIGNQAGYGKGRSNEANG